jgi:hypothetical protein
VFFESIAGKHSKTPRKKKSVKVFHVTRDGSGGFLPISVVFGGFFDMREGFYELLFVDQGVF